MRLEYFTAPCSYNVDGSLAEKTSVREQKLVPSTTLGKIIAGKACAYSEWHVSLTGQVEVFTSSCFKLSLVAWPKVSFLLDHDPEKKLGDTESGLELFSDNGGLWFSFRPLGTMSHQEVLADVINGKRTQMSVGYRVGEDSYFKTDDGINVRMISVAILEEISLVRTNLAAVKSTRAFAISSSELGSLEVAACSGRLELMGELRCATAALTGKILEARPRV